MPPTVLTTIPPLEGASALEHAFARHHAAAVRLAYLLTGDLPAAEDAVAEVWVKVHRRLARGPIEDLPAYLRRAVVNQVNSRFRRLRLVRREAARRTGDHRGQRAHDEQVAESQVLLDALAQLPERTRAVVVLRYYEDLSVADTAAALHITEGGVKSATSRGLQMLRSILEGSA